MTAVVTTLMPCNEEIRTVFCTDNMTNNIQYGVTSHYSSMSGGATANSLEGMVIGMGFTIGITNISQWRGFKEGESVIVYKGWSQGVWGTSVPSMV